MSTIIDLGPWRMECEPEATQEAYASIAAGGPDDCTCDGCRNWIALRQRIYSPSFRRLLEPLGITCEKETEIYRNGRLPTGRHSYGGWWHFIGRIVEDAGGYWAPPGVDHLRLMFVEHNALAAPSFPNDDVLQLDLDAELPWVLDEPEPD